MLRKAFTIGAILTAVVIVAILLSVCVEKEKITLPSSESTEPPKPSIYQEEILAFMVHVMFMSYQNPQEKKPLSANQHTQVHLQPL